MQIGGRKNLARDVADVPENAVREPGVEKEERAAQRVEEESRGKDAAEDPREDRVLEQLRVVVALVRCFVGALTARRGIFF